MWKKFQKKKQKEEKPRSEKRRRKAFSRFTRLKRIKLLGNVQHVNAAVPDTLWRIMATDTLVAAADLHGINTLKWHNALLKCDDLND